MSDTTTLAARLRWARSRTGLKQTELAERIGRKQPAISDLEQGLVVPTLSTAERLAEALAVDPGWLAFGRRLP